MLNNNHVHYTITSVEEAEIWPLEDVKNYLRVSHDKDDRLIAGLTKSAILAAEKFLGLCIFTKKITCIIDSSSMSLRLKHIPILKINNIWHVNGAEKENIADSFGHVNSIHEQIFFAPRYYGKKLEIAYDAGFGDKLPRTIMQGILSHIGAMYDMGDSTGFIGAEVRDLYLPYRSLKV